MTTFNQSCIDCASYFVCPHPSDNPDDPTDCREFSFDFGDEWDDFDWIDDDDWDDDE